jgi:hypothetical protein
VTENGSLQITFDSIKDPNLLKELSDKFGFEIDTGVIQTHRRSVAKLVTSNTSFRLCIILSFKNCF